MLHLSDLQFGRAHRDVSGLTEADRAADRLFARLHTDLTKLADTKLADTKLADGRGLRPDLVIVTGDLAEWGLASESQQVERFLDDLLEAVELPRHRLAIVSGNHDINRKACEQYFLGEEADEREPQAPYWPKWRHYAAFFGQMYADTGSSASPEFTPERPWSLFEMTIATSDSTVAMLLHHSATVLRISACSWTREVKAFQFSLNQAAKESQPSRC